MRLLPRGLFGRLVLILLCGLIFAQLVTAYLNLSERDQLLYRASGMQTAQRIADVSKLLDSVPAAERRRIVAVFNAPPLAISLERSRWKTSSRPTTERGWRRSAARRRPTCGFPCSRRCWATPWARACAFRR